MLKLTVTKQWLTSLFVVLTSLVIAQVPYPVETGGGINFTSYTGDLSGTNPEISLKNSKTAFSAHLRRMLNNQFALRLNIMAGFIRGDEKVYSTPEWRQERGISFISPLMELSVLGEYYPFGAYHKQLKPRKDGTSDHHGVTIRRRIAPFLMAGAGVATTNPVVNWNDANGNSELDPAMVELDKSAKTGKVNFVVPFGGGIRCAINNQLTLGLEVAFRPTFSDYLDGVCQVGNPAADDWYYSGGITLSYAIREDKDIPPAPSPDWASGIAGAASGQDKTSVPPASPDSSNAAKKPGNTAPDTDVTWSIQSNPAPAADKIQAPSILAIPLSGIPFKSVYFETGKFVWQDTDNATMDEVAKAMNNFPDMQARIEGHADNTGDETVNTQLSEQRAKFAYHYLISKGIAVSRITYKGYSTERPVSTNSTPRGRQLNRRVEIYLNN